MDANSAAVVVVCPGPGRAQSGAVIGAKLTPLETLDKIPKNFTT